MIALVIDMILFLFLALQAPDHPAHINAPTELYSLLADLLAGVLYVLAGAVGGYARKLWLVRLGNCCWLLGSLASGVRPCLALSAEWRARCVCAPRRPRADRR